MPRAAVTAVRAATPEDHVPVVLIAAQPRAHALVTVQPARPKVIIAHRALAFSAGPEDQHVPRAAATEEQAAAVQRLPLHRPFHVPVISVPEAHALQLRLQAVAQVTV